MSELVFLANAGGQLTVTNENASGNNTVTIPATDGTLLIEDNSGNLSVTNLTVTGSVDMTGTGQMLIPVGNTSERSDSPIEGMIRYNTDGGGFYEGYEAGEWVKFTTQSQGSYAITYLVVAGGGGGQVAGGGAGGFLEGALTFIPGTIYIITVGAGGATGSNGTNSAIVNNVVAIGGGAGSTGGPGFAGGSGGGGSNVGYAQPGGAGTSGQGNAGGSGNGAQVGGAGTGGGGGAGQVGQNGQNPGGGNGGNGLQSSITGSAIYYAGGGGGGSDVGPPPSSGGLGGGGGAGVDGTANTGGGAGAVFRSGGSGVVILSIPTISYSGTTTGSPTITVNGSFTVVKFTSSGTYTA